jgi:hypothetical protein
LRSGIGTPAFDGVNSGRLQVEAAQNLSFLRFRNTSPNPVGFFLESLFPYSI